MIWQTTARYLDLIGADSSFYRAFCEPCQELCPELMRAGHVSRAQTLKIETDVLNISSCLRTEYIPEGRTYKMRSVKLHWLLSHVVSQARILGIVGSGSDQSIERKHQDEIAFRKKVVSCKTEMETFRLQSDYLLATEQPEYLKCTDFG